MREILTDKKSTPAEYALPRWEGSLLPLALEWHTSGRNSASKCRVLLENGTSMVLYEAEIRRFSIREGCRLEGEAYTELMQALCKRTRGKALSLLKQKDWTEQEMRAKLWQYAGVEAVAEDAISYLYHWHYLNDESYISRYLFQNRERKSARRIAWELEQKGLPREQIQRVMDQDGQDGQEEAAARMLYEKYCRTRGGEDAALQQKAAAYLRRQGFSWEVVSAVIRAKDRGAGEEILPS